MPWLIGKARQNLGKPADVILERSLIGNMQGSNTPCLWPIESFWLMKISQRMFSKKKKFVGQNWVREFFVKKNVF